MSAHYSGPTFIEGPDSFAGYTADAASPQKWLISLAVSDELARSFGIKHTTLPAVIDNFGDLVVVPA